jgi:ATP-dependent Clp protease ATP-binding subunit ClpX
MRDEKIPTKKELEKELNEFLQKKYGGKVLGVLPPFSREPGHEETGEYQPPDYQSSGREINFDIRPRELKEFLDQYVIKQDDAKEVLATKICTHYHRIQLLRNGGRFHQFQDVGNIKNNIIMLGSTGVGKTYLVKLIANKIGVPFVKGDATKFSETGYVGGDVEDLVRNLVREANGDIEWAQYGIIYIDEIDKIASHGTHYGLDVSRTGVQRALLKPMEETEVSLKVPHDPLSQLQALENYRKTGKSDPQTINTKHILFIVSGAFSGLEALIQKRLHKQQIGFGAASPPKDKSRISLLRQVKAEDFIEYGFESEFIGRLPIVTILDDLEEEDLFQILKNKNCSITLNKKFDFKSYGIDIQFESAALREIASRAHKEKTGARGLVSVIERSLIKFEQLLPSTNIEKFVVTPETIQNPQTELDKLMKDPYSVDLMERYELLLREEKNSIRQSIIKRRVELQGVYHEMLDNEAIEMIVDNVVIRGYTVDQILERIIKIHETLKSYEREFFLKWGIEITLDQSAVNYITAEALRKEVSPQFLCEQIFRNYEHGLRMIEEKTGQKRFLLDKEAILDSEKFLNHLIQESFRQGS